MDKFLKIQNFKLCQDAFGKWMSNVYGFDIAKSDLETEKMLFDTMKSVKVEFINDSEVSLTELNNVALNKLQDEIVSKFKLIKVEKSMSQMDRDVSAFGPRPSVMNSLTLPQNTTNKDYNNINYQFDAELSSRKGIEDPVPPIGLTAYQEPEEPIPSDVFEKLLNTRKMNLEANIELQLPIVPDDPKAMYMTPPTLYKAGTATLPAASALGVVASTSAASASAASVASAAATSDASLESRGLIEPSLGLDNLSNVFVNQPTDRKIVKKYITMNGFDREWTVQKKRCSFSINLNNFATTYRNIATIRMTKLIIPNEIIEHRSLLNMPKFQHHHDQKLAYPYLCLQVDEISDVCDGVNQAVQKSFAQFVYESSYKCPNGRGYVILEPAQKETKVYYPQCLSSLQRLTFSITKPNGTLFNNNNDDYNIHKAEYELYNNLYIKIITDKYFDKNEFYIGDHIQLTGFTMYKPPSAPPTLNPGDFDSMARFVCRAQGHEIVQLGDANENGFYRSFYVLGPCIMDQSIGKLVIDKNLVDSLKEYNMVTCPHSQGQIINLSLQITISMTVGIDVADRAVLMTRPV